MNLEPTRAASVNVNLGPWNPVPDSPYRQRKVEVLGIPFNNLGLGDTLMHSQFVSPGNYVESKEKNQCTWIHLAASVVGLSDAGKEVNGEEVNEKAIELKSVAMKDAQEFIDLVGSKWEISSASAEEIALRMYAHDTLKKGHYLDLRSWCCFPPAPSASVLAVICGEADSFEIIESLSSDPSFHFLIISEGHMSLLQPRERNPKKLWNQIISEILKKSLPFSTNQMEGWKRVMERESPTILIGTLQECAQCNEPRLRGPYRHAIGSREPAINASHRDPKSYSEEFVERVMACAQCPWKNVPFRRPQSVEQWSSVYIHLVHNQEFSLPRFILVAWVGTELVRQAGSVSLAHFSLKSMSPDEGRNLDLVKPFLVADRFQELELVMSNGVSLQNRSLPQRRVITHPHPGCKDNIAEALELLWKDMKSIRILI